MQVVVEHLSKTYAPDSSALCDVSFSLGPGITGLAGPNGSGKTTLLRILATLLAPSSGAVRFDGQDVLTNPLFARLHLGYVPQDFGVYPQFTAEQFLDFLAQLDGVRERSLRHERVAAALEAVQLTQYARKRLGTFSGGMRQRIGIAQALMREPAVLLLDEPTSGLDPALRQELYSLLAVLGARTTIFISTHILSDIASICSQVFILTKGQVRASGSPQDLVNAVEGCVFTYVADVDQAVATDRPVQQGKCSYQVLSSSRERDGLSIRLYTPDVNAVPPGAVAVVPTFDDAYFILVEAATQEPRKDTHLPVAAKAFFKS